MNCHNYYLNSSIKEYEFNDIKNSIFINDSSVNLSVLVLILK